MPQDEQTNLGSPPPHVQKAPAASKHSRQVLRRPRKELQGELKAGPGLKPGLSGPS